MAKKRQIPLQLFKLAEDLGLKASADPQAAILEYCRIKVDTFLREMGDCISLSDFLNWMANRVGTSFRIVRHNVDLENIKSEFLNLGEKVFARLESELSSDVYGVTYRLQNAKPWEHQFVSVIDCRGIKGSRSYFTKWHEIAHLLTLTEQMRLVFRRTHSEYGKQDPEEHLMDVIAGRFGFHLAVFERFIASDISFDEIERLRRELCPEASLQASLISFHRYWPSPSMLLRVELGFNRDQKQKLQQNSFDFVEEPEAVLRAVSVSVNEAARGLGFQLFENMRVPPSSFLHQIFLERLNNGEGMEDFAQWTGREAMSVKIIARFRDEGIDALIAPVL
ncbi:MAG: hypothetical protein ACR2IH_12400 [Pyrinomonadaceae bacterium]